MPTYEFICNQCGKNFESFQSMSAPDPACPDCGGSAKRKIVAGAGIIMRGGSSAGCPMPGGCAASPGGCGSSHICGPGCGEH